MKGAHTMSIVKKLCDVQSTAGRPRQGLTELSVYRGHDMVLAKMSKKPLTVLSVIMRHAQNMA